MGTNIAKNLLPGVLYDYTVIILRKWTVRY